MGLIHALNLYGATMTATANGNHITLSGYYTSPGTHECFAVQNVYNAGASSDDGSVAGAVQYSATTVDTDFANITGGTFTTVNDSDASTMEQINFLIPASAGYIRYKGTVAGGSPKMATVCNLFLQKRVS